MPRSVRGANAGTAVGTAATTAIPKRGRNKRTRVTTRTNLINWTTPQAIDALSMHVAQSLNGYKTMPKGADLVHTIGLSVQGFFGAQRARL